MPYGKLAGIGIFKVGFSSIGVTNPDNCTASTITSRRVLFQPEIERIVTGSVEKEGKIVQKYGKQIIQIVITILTAISSTILVQSCGI